MKSQRAMERVIINLFRVNEGHVLKRLPQLVVKLSSFVIMNFYHESQSF